MTRHFDDRFYRAVDPDGTLARTNPAELARRVDHARSAYFAGLAFRSVQMRQDEASRRRVEEAATLHAQQCARGICSRPGCEQPISGWCATCDAGGPFRAPKLCERHLMLHCRTAGHTPRFPYGGSQQEEGSETR